MRAASAHSHTRQLFSWPQLTRAVAKCFKRRGRGRIVPCLQCSALSCCCHCCFQRSCGLDHRLPRRLRKTPHPHQMIALKVNHGSKVAPFPDDQRKVSGQVTCRGTESDCAGAYRCHLTSWRLAQAVASLEPLLRSSAALPEVGEHRLSCAHGARAALVPQPREPPVALLRGVWRRLARHALSSRQPGPSNGATTNGNHTKMLSLQDDKHVIKRDTG